MTGPAGLEQGYRRLLAWYPAGFRSEQGEEMLAVLMAGAQPGQRRPSLLESLDVLRSAVRMRLRSMISAPQSQGWADALAVFSVAAPLFLLAVDILEVALPYRVRATSRFPLLEELLSRHPEVGGLSLLRVQFFDIAVGCQVIIAVLALLGLRWAALAAIGASAAYVAVASTWIDWIPRPLQLLTAAAYLLTAAALAASPGPRRGRQLLTWGHGIVLLLAAGAVQASTLRYDATTPIMGTLSHDATPSVSLVVTVVLAVAALAVAGLLRVNRYFLLLLAAMFYPYVMQLAYPTNSSSGDLLGHPTPAHLAVLFGPPLLVAAAAVIIAATHRRASLPAGPGQPGVA
jgi:hypothetical protein